MEDNIFFFFSKNIIFSFFIERLESCTSPQCSLLLAVLMNWIPPAHLEKHFYSQCLSYLQEYLLQFFKEAQQMQNSMAVKATPTC